VVHNVSDDMSAQVSADVDWPADVPVMSFNASRMSGRTIGGAVFDYA